MKTIWIAVTVAMLSIVYARADERSVTNASPAYLSDDYVGKFGVGIMVGEPTGVSAKYWLNHTMALDGAAGWSFRDHTDFYLHSDVLWHKFDLFSVPNGRMPLYFGVGGLLRFRDDNHDDEFGIRAPIGVSYMLRNAPIDIFAEVAPAIDLTPTVRADITGGVGIRYWF